LNLLLDTHILLWAASEPEKLTAKMQSLITDADNQLFFSPANLWVWHKEKFRTPGFSSQCKITRDNKSPD